VENTAPPVDPPWFGCSTTVHQMQ